MNVDMVFTYMEFVEERHNVFLRRQAGQPPHWSSDPILQRNKFTNVYRVLDRGSQYLLQQLLNTAESAEDALARSFLYRMSNLPDVWEFTKGVYGYYPGALQLDETLANVWAEFRDAGNQVFSGAYTIMPLPGVAGFDKAKEVVRMAANSFNPGSANYIGQAFLSAQSMAQRFKVLRAIPNVGDFLAMQVLTDFGYSPYGTEQDENEFVVGGPGCRKGAKELFPELRVDKVIAWCHKEVNRELHLEGVGGRQPSMMDIQNTLCEFSKYARFMRKPTPPRVYTGTVLQPQNIVLPEHW